LAYAEVNGLSQYYEEHGSGEPLVLLHGGVAGSEIFTAMLPALAAERRVILVDLQGSAVRGRSTGRCGRSCWRATSPR